MQRPNLENLLEHYLPSSTLSSIGQACEVDYNVSKLYGSVMFKLLFYSQTTCDRSTQRTLATLYSSDLLSRFIGSSDRTRHSSIASRLSTMKVDYFACIYEQLCKHVKKEPLHIGDKSFHLNIIDSTLVKYSARLLHIGIVNKRTQKTDLKFTLSLQDGIPHTIELHTSSSFSNENIALTKAVYDSNQCDDTIHVFDKGLHGINHFEDFCKQNIFFITPISTQKYEILSLHQCDSQIYDYLCECIIQFVNQRRRIQRKYCLIIAVENGKTFYFITNLWGIHPELIAEIYRMRWKIEVFFRFLKHNLKFKHFSSLSENGILISMYMTLIVAILMMIMRNLMQRKSYLKDLTWAQVKFAIQEHIIISILKDRMKNTGKGNPFP